MNKEVGYITPLFILLILGCLGAEVDPDSTQRHTSSPSLIEDEVMRIGLSKVAGGFDRPIYVTHSDDGSGRLFLVEQGGIVWVLENDTILPSPFLDLRDRVGAMENEQGLLGIAFHPRFQDNGYFFVYYTNNEADTIVSRFMAATGPYRADRGSEEVVLKIEQPFGNHNGGQIAFGPDGYFYIGVGDGGSGGDPLGSGQNPSTLLGSILRIDVSSLPYSIPESNPYFSGDGGLPEVWVFGLRNPWRFSFDRFSGALYIGDVGQNNWEEIDFLPTNSSGGKNLGWNEMEGSRCFKSGCDPGLYEAPVTEYGHSEGCSVTGGYVYRGNNLGLLQGLYIFGDYCSGTIWSLEYKGGEWRRNVLMESDLRISSFGEDESGELYVVDHRGGLYRFFSLR